MYMNKVVSVKQPGTRGGLAGSACRVAKFSRYCSEAPGLGRSTIELSKFHVSCNRRDKQFT